MGHPAVSVSTPLRVVQPVYQSTTAVPVEQVERIRIKSPLSATIIIAYDPSTRETERTVCSACLDLVQGRLRLTVRRGGPYFEAGVGDPLYFLGAGVRFSTVVVPYYGRIAYAKRANIDRFLRRFKLEDKIRWEELTGTPFPYKLFK
jgi:hypothetical protein